MQILLLNPRRRRGISYTVIPNVGLGYVAEALRKEGHGVFILDANRDRIGPNRLAKVVEEKAPDLLGVTTFSSFLGSVRDYVQAAKKARPLMTIVLGGPHPTYEPRHTFATVPEADFLVMGEGEQAAASLCRYLERGEGDPAAVPNLAWKQGSDVRVNDVCFIEDIDGLGMPAWDLLEPHKFPCVPNGIFSRAASVAPIIATRGCPYQCTFCGAGLSMGKKLRSRSPESIRDEMETLHKRYGIGEVHFMDDNFTQDREMVSRLCELLIEKGPRIPWACPNGIRIDRIDAKTARLMERAGCYSLALGIEFGTDRLLAAVKKALTVERIESQVRMLRENTAFRLTGFFIIGHPDETEQDVRRTIDFSLRLPLDRANYFNFTPFPGSALYDRLKNEGALDAVNMENLYIHSVAYHPPAIPAGRLVRLQRGAHVRFYLRPRVIFGILGEIKGWAQVRVVLSRAWHLITGR